MTLPNILRIPTLPGANMCLLSSLQTSNAAEDPIPRRCWAGGGMLDAPGDLVNWQHARADEAVLLSSLAGIPLPLLCFACTGMGAQGRNLNKRKHW